MFDEMTRIHHSMFMWIS